jgi:hypothetical protein
MSGPIRVFLNTLLVSCPRYLWDTTLAKPLLDSDWLQGCIDDGSTRCRAAECAAGLRDEMRFELSEVDLAFGRVEKLLSPVLRDADESLG